MSITPYTGLYINLDRSPERRREFEGQLRTYNIFDRYVRLPATDGTLIQSPRATVKPGEIGCFHSHYRALLHAKPSGLPVHVVEDDALLSEHVDGFARDRLARQPQDRTTCDPRSRLRKQLIAFRRTPHSPEAQRPCP